jgi:hypothetical protein
MKKLKIDLIRTDGGTQMREVIDQERVYQFVADMKDGDEFPRIFAVFDGSNYWLVDGFHRYHAMKLMGLKEIEIDYKPGTLDEARALAYSVNNKHGKPPTNADKRKAVADALTNPLTMNKSDNEIAKICGCSHPMVAAMRRPDAKERQEKNRQKSMAKKLDSGKPESDSTVESDSTPKAIEPNPQDGAAPDDSEIKAAELALQADQDAMYKLLESDDALKTAHEEIKRLNHLNAQLEIRLHGLMNERNEAVKMVKKLQKELDKLKGKK